MGYGLKRKIERLKKNLKYREDAFLRASFNKKEYHFNIPAILMRLSCEEKYPEFKYHILHVLQSFYHSANHCFKGYERLEKWVKKMEIYIKRKKSLEVIYLSNRLNSLFLQTSGMIFKQNNIPSEELFKVFCDKEESKKTPSDRLFELGLTLVFKNDGEICEKYGRNVLDFNTDVIDFENKEKNHNRLYFNLNGILKGENK